MPIFRALLQNEPDSLYDKNCHQNSVFSWTVIDCTIYGALCCHLSSLIRTQRAFNKWQGKESTFLIDLNDSIESQHYIPWPKPAARRGNGKNIFHLSANNITYSTTYQAKIENEYKNCWLHGRRPFRYPPAQRYRRRVPTYRYIIHIGILEVCICMSNQQIANNEIFMGILSLCASRVPWTLPVSFHLLANRVGVLSCQR